MSGYPFGLLILIVLSILVFFGVFQRVLDRMRVKDSTALLIIAAIIAGSFINIPIISGRQELIINLGGSLIPMAMVVYLWVKAGTNKEKIRSILASIVTALALTVASFFIGMEPGTLVDPLYLFPIIAGLTGYLAGRSRRSAFIAAVFGTTLYDLAHYVWLLRTGIRGTTHLGGGGTFDSLVIAAIIAVALAELIGETRERLQGGPSSEGRDPSLLKNLTSVEGEEGENRD